MTASRTRAPSADVAAPPVFPLWPYACTAYAEHCSRDYVHYLDRLAHPEEPHTAEEALGLDMLTDMNQAFFSLVWAPLGAVIAAETTER